MDREKLLETLQAVQAGKMTPEAALGMFAQAPYEDIGYAKIDHHRGLRNGSGEVIYGAGKTAEQIAGIVERMVAAGSENILITRMDADKAAQLLSIIASDAPMATLDALTGKCASLDEGIAELKTVVGLLPGLGVPDDKWEIDLTIARGLDYYTGTVYETTLLDHPEVGSVCSGGRYDNLAGYYTDKKLPGVGVSIGVTRLFYILQEQGLLNEELDTAPCDALVIPMGDTMAYAVSCATALRRAGVRTQVYNEPKKVKAKFAYADKLSIPFAVIVGEDEAAAGSVGLKNLATGEQQSLSAEDAARVILQNINRDIKPVKGI